MQERYRKLELLGQGATARVYLVEEKRSGKRYAMKVCENGALLRFEAKMLECATSEAVCCEQFGHARDILEGVEQAAACRSHFPAFAAYLEEENALVMEYLEGKDLQALLDSGERFEAAEVRWIMQDVLQALEVLHERGIIYRDLKPANIMLCRDGCARLVDFGAACYEMGSGSYREEHCTVEENVAKQKNVKAGTYGYAAPEQFWEGTVPDRTCDIYSAGKVFAYLISGKNPVEPPYDMENYCKGLKGVAPEFLEVIARCLAVNPAGRYKDCEEMRRGIELAFDGVAEMPWLRRRRKMTRIYEKCIWLSEYRRIF